MDAIQRRMLARGEEVGRAHVGSEHALLDQAVRVVAHFRDDLRDLAVVVENHARFGGLEVDRTALGARLEQHAEQLVEVLQVGQQRGELLARGGVLLVQGCRYLGVGQARMRPDHRRIEAVGLDVARHGDAHVGHHGQTLDLRVQRAEAVGELLRQHRDHPAREVHRVAAVVGVLVQRPVGGHIVRHVGNRHQQTVTAALALAIHRVVEVLGRLAVDGDQRQRGQVLAADPVLLAHLQRQLARLGLGLGGKIERQVVLAQRDLDLHAGVGIVAEHLDDASDRLGVLGRLLDQLDGDHLPGLRLLAARRDQDVLRQAPVFRHHDHHAMLVQHAADDALVGALEHLDDAAFRPAAAIDARDAHDGAVAVQHFAHVAGADEDVGSTVVAAQEAEAVGVALDAALDEVGLVGQQVGVATVADELPVALHRAQPAVEVLQLVRLDVQRLGQRGKWHRHAAVGKDIQDVFAAWERLLVFLRLTLEMRIGKARAAQPRPCSLRCTMARRFACCGRFFGSFFVVH